MVDGYSDEEIKLREKLIRQIEDGFKTLNGENNDVEKPHLKVVR